MVEDTSYCRVVYTGVQGGIQGSWQGRRSRLQGLRICQCGKERRLRDDIVEVFILLF